jgi:DNA invertase Pin-like site-specific DNA recombinase
MTVLSERQVVWKLDRLSRSLKDLLHVMERLDQAKAGFRSLTESVDTTTSAGRMLMPIFVALCRSLSHFLRF